MHRLIDYPCFSRILAVLAAITVFPAAAAEPVSWEIDSSHSSVQFAVRHMMLSTVRGQFGGLKGSIQYDPADVSRTVVEAAVAAKEVDTRNAKRDAHLRNPDFFDVEKFPTMMFKSKRVEPAREGRLKMTGDLTIRGVTKEVVFDVEGLTAPVKDQRGQMRIGASATTKINRKDFGLTWNRALETGGVLVGDEVAVTLDVQLRSANTSPAAASSR